MKKLIRFLATVQVLVAFSGFNPVLGHTDPPELVDVFIVTDASDPGESWSGNTTPNPVGSGITVQMRAVVKAGTGASEDYYWDHSSESVSDLDGDTRDVCRWDWINPSITWKRIMPHMNRSEWDTTDTPHDKSNDPWNPTEYEKYTNRVARHTAETNPVQCKHGYSYSFPGFNTDLGDTFGTSGGHTCTEYRGVYSRTFEGNGYDTIEYEHLDMDPTGWDKNDSSGNGAGTRRYQISGCTLESLTKYTPGKEQTSTVSNLVYDDASDDDAYNRGITNDVTRIVRKSNHDCDYIKHIESYKEVPWIYSSRWQQADDYIGFDCADLAVGAAKKAEYTASYTTANGLVSSRSPRGSYGELYMDGSTVKKDSDDLNADVAIGTDPDELHIGDLIMIDWTDDGTYDHTTVLYEDLGTTGTLDGADELIFAGATGVETETLANEISSNTPRFVLREGWPN